MLKGIKTIHEIIFIITINYEFTFGLELDTSIRTKCSVRMRVILGSGLCEEAPSKMSLTSLKLKVVA